MAKWDQETKTKALDIAEKATIRQAAEATGVPEGTIKRWRSETGFRTNRTDNSEPNRTENSKAAVDRLKPYQFKPGQSGNPGGKPKGMGKFRELCRSYMEEAVEAIVELARKKKTPPSIKLAAWQYLLDQGWGKPRQAVEVGGQVTNRYEWDITQRIISDPESTQLAEQLLTRLAGNAGRLRMDR